MKPRILIVTTRRWFSAARLAMAFAASGCRVEIACSSNHPAMLIRDIAARYPVRALSPLRSLHSAICKSNPQIIVPSDDLALSYLHRLYQQAPSIDEGTAQYIRSLLSRSLGEPESFSLVSSRTKFLAAAREEGIQALPTQEIPNLLALRRWLAENSLPAVLKADGTSGGEGVKIARTEKEAIRAWRKLNAPIDLARVINKACCDHDPHYLIPWFSRRRRTVSIQPFIHGHDSNIAVACWKGELLGAISLDVLRAWRPKGPASLVELSQNDEMIDAARIMVRRLRLSGLCGFDFITDHATGRTRLIEINARATQTCHLPHGVPRDLIGSLVSALAGRALPALNQARRRGIIALFPLAWQSGIPMEMLESTHHDIPWEEPLLVQAGFAGKDKSFYEKCVDIWARIHPPRALAGEIE